MALGIVGFKTWWGPYVFAHYQYHWAPKQFARIVEGYGMTLFLIASLLLLSIPELFHFLIDERYHSSISIVCWLIVAKVMYFFGDYSSIGIGITKATYIRTFGGFGLALINIVLNLWLIPIWGINGAVAATFMSFLLYSIYLQINSQRLYHIPVFWPIVIILGGILISLTYVVHSPIHYRMFVSLIILTSSLFFLRFRTGVTKRMLIKSLSFRNQDVAHA